MTTEKKIHDKKSQPPPAPVMHWLEYAGQIVWGRRKE